MQNLGFGKKVWKKTKQILRRVAVEENKVFFLNIWKCEYPERLRYGSNSIVISQRNLGSLCLDEFSKNCIQKLDFLHRLEEAQKFVVVDPHL